MRERWQGTDVERRKKSLKGSFSDLSEVIKQAVAEENYKNFRQRTWRLDAVSEWPPSENKLKTTACNNLLRHSIRNGEELLFPWRVYSMLSL